MYVFLAKTLYFGQKTKSIPHNTKELSDMFLDYSGMTIPNLNIDHSCNIDIETLEDWQY